MNSGASKHTTSYKAAFDVDYVLAPNNVHLDDNGVIKSIIVKTINKDSIFRICSKNAFYVSKFHVNFFNVRKLVSNGLSIRFNLNKCIVKSCNGEVIMNAPHECKLYKINFMKVHKADATNLMYFPTRDGAHITALVI